MPDAPRTFEIDVRFTVDDWITIRAYYQLDSPVAKRGRLRRVVALLFFVGALLCMIVPAFIAIRCTGLSGNATTSFNLAIPFCVGSCVYILTLVCLVGSSPRSVQLRRIKDGVLADADAGTLYEGSQKASVGADYVRIVTDYGESLVSWRGISGVETTALWAFIMLENATVLYVPRRAFDSDQDFHSFTSFVTEQINRSRTAG